MKKIHYIAPILLQAGIYIVTIVLFKTFARFRVEGAENVYSAQGPVIFSPNHTSEWDGILVRTALPFFSKRFSPMYYVAMQKSEYTLSSWRGFFYGGFLFKLLGAYPRYSGKKDYAYALQNHIAILKLGRNVCIFPEGKRSRNGAIGEAHGGVTFLSGTTGAPVIPVRIYGLVNFTLTSFLKRERSVSIHFGKPVSAQELIGIGGATPESYKAGAERIMCEVAAL